MYFMICCGFAILLEANGGNLASRNKVFIRKYTKLVSRESVVGPGPVVTTDIGLDVLGSLCVMSRRGSRLFTSVRKGSTGEAELQCLHVLSCLNWPAALCSPSRVTAPAVCL